MRTCKKCGIEKELEHFAKDNRRKPTHECKVCCLKRQAAWLKLKRKKFPVLVSFLPRGATKLIALQRSALVARIYKHVVVSKNGCHEWDTAKRNFELGNVRKGSGYPGMDVKLGDRWFRIPVCRVIAALFDGLDLNDSKAMGCHHCDNPACVSPSHIYAGDNSTNQRDRFRRSA